MDEDDYWSMEDDEEEELVDDDGSYSFDDDDDECYNEVEVSDLQQQVMINKKPTSQVINKRCLDKAQKECLVRVMELLTVNKNQARTLLIHYQWNVDKLFSVYADRGKDSLFSSAGLAVSCNNNNNSNSCDICMEDDLSSFVMRRMDCGHSFCSDCWKEHFTVRINEGESKRIKCMAHKCNVICNEDVVRSLVSPVLAEKFDRFLVESYVEDNHMVKWCPSVPHCGNAIRKLENDGDNEVICACGLQFCFDCLSESHSPCSCMIWKLWSKKCQDESETVNWITVNTRLCPKCTKPVHKNEGCNLITCVCGQHFCWLCGGATGRDHTWTSIAGHSCGKYKEDKVRQLERAKRDLDRYTHYHFRYKAHMDSAKLEDKLRADILEKAVSNSEKKDGIVFKEYSWIIDATDRLMRSRRILPYTYAFAFYMFGEELFQDDMTEKEREIKKNLFEDQQQQLEGNVEKLSKILQEPFDEYDYDTVVMMKNQITNSSAAVDDLCNKMYKCIENDLLGPIQVGIHNISPYKSKGIRQSAKFCPDSCDCNAVTSMDV